MKKKLLKLFALLAAALLLVGCKKSAAEEQIKLPIYNADEIRFEVAEAKVMDISEKKSVAAVIGYPYADNIMYPASAQVVSFNAIANRDVAAGEVLAELDSSSLDYEISNQRALVDAAAASRGTAAGQLNYELELSRLNMLLAQKESYTIRAPFDGVITAVTRAASGSSVSEGDFCCAISEKSKPAVYIEGGDAALFRFGQSVEVKIDGVIYEAKVVAAPDIAPEYAAGKALAVLDLGEGVLEKLEQENYLAFGAGWATAYVTSERKNVLAVPESAVKTVGSVSYVMIVDGDERYKLFVTPGETLGGYTEILNGISEGDIVMAEGSGVFSDSLA